MNELQWLQEWYNSRTDGKWEHSFGIRIETIDNPGWMVWIDLDETKCGGIEELEIVLEESETHWMQCRIRGRRFEGVGDPTRLSQIISTFRDWIEGSTK